MNPDDTIVAVSSPRGVSARGIVRLSGPRAVAIAGGVFATSTADGPGAADRGRFASEVSTAGGKNQYVDGWLMLGPARMPAAAYVFHQPRSYTRQNVVELHTLGAPGLLGMIVETCMAAGARRAEPGEFTARAFLAGVFDLSQVHGIAGMIAARSDCQLRAAERLLHGHLSQIAGQAREELADLLSLVEGALDFADEPIEFISPGELQARLERARDGLQATVAAGLRAERWGQSPQVALVGGPNVGKSSLLNRLTGLDRALCAPLAGTTRDVLSAPLDLGATDCLLIDMAGLGSALESDPLHKKAQDAARQAVKDADLILEVIDGGAPASAAARRPFADAALRLSTPRIIVVNKCDLIGADRRERLLTQLAGPTGAAVCVVSALTGEGCDDLKREIGQALTGRTVEARDAAIALMAEHREALERALEAMARAIDLARVAGQSLVNAELVAAELRVAVDALAALVGREDVEDLLGRVFSRFCVGK